MTVGFLQKYSDIKTPAPGFDFETCSAHAYSTKSKPFGKSIFQVSLDIVAGATNKSMYGKHCLKPYSNGTSFLNYV